MHDVSLASPPARSRGRLWVAAGLGALLGGAGTGTLVASAGGRALPPALLAGLALAVLLATAAGTWLLHRLGEGAGKAVHEGPVQQAQARAFPAPGTPLAAAQAAGGEPGDFGSAVAHDLRAPLRVVEGFTRIVKEDYGAALDRLGHDHLDRVLAATARMNAMIEALLELSRLSAQPLARQPVALSRLAESVVEELRRQSPQRRVEVHIEPGLTVQGDPVLLHLLLDNLLGNAWKYSARREDARIELGCEPRDGCRVFRVSDNGAGFDMRHAGRLFEVFQRLHAASEFPGSGVGLATVRRIVRRHGGEIRAEAAPGQGASFLFTLDGPLPRGGAGAPQEGARSRV